MTETPDEYEVAKDDLDAAIPIAPKCGGKPPLMFVQSNSSDTHHQPNRSHQHEKESHDENHHTHTDPDHVFPARR